MVTRFIETEYDRKMLYRFTATQKLPFSVTFERGRKRSVDQNRLQRLWVKEIAEQLGDRTQEDVRAYCKLHHGVPIRREHDDFRELYDKIVRPLSYEDKLSLMAVPIDLPVTRDMSAKEHSRYLDAIHKEFTELGVVLTDPETLGRQVETA